MSKAIRIGTSGWSYDDWCGPFYAAGTAKGDYLGAYTDHFDVVEVDSTFYRPPSDKVVAGWAARTPAGFGFALKIPQTITHDKMLVDCDADMDTLLESVALLGDKLKALLLQFGYFNRAAFPNVAAFFKRLAPFLARYAAQAPLACEIRNKAWLTAEYFDLLRAHRVSAALVEQAWLPPINDLLDHFDMFTGPFAYVRLLGDRQGIERVTKTWGDVVVDRGKDIARIAAALRRIAEHADVLVFVNNHYAGHAPATCRALRQALDQS